MISDEVLKTVTLKKKSFSTETNSISNKVILEVKCGTRNQKVDNYANNDDERYLPDFPEDVLESEEEIKKLKLDYFGVNMDKWIDCLQQPNETIQTISRKLTIKEAKLFLIINTKMKELKSDGMNDFSQIPLQENNKKLLNDFISDLKKLISTSSDGKNGFLMKLSCRSPKDITPIHIKTFQLYQKLLPKYLSVCDKNNVEMIKNQKLCTFYEATLQCMRVFSVEEGLNLLFQSERIAFDLKLDLRFPQDFSTSVIMRPWLQDMNLESEFRGFVYKNRMTSISQYFTQCYFPRIEKNKDLIRDSICSFFYQVVRPKLMSISSDLENYIIDFVVLFSSVEISNPKVLVLEMNPFLTTTGAGLFNWDTDLEILHGKGLEDFTNEENEDYNHVPLRILSSPIVTQLIKDKQIVKEWIEEIEKDN